MQDRHTVDLLDTRTMKRHIGSKRSRFDVCLSAAMHKSWDCFWKVGDATTIKMMVSLKMIDDEDPPTVCDPVEDDTNFGDVDMDEPGNKKAPANTVFGGPVEGSRRERRYLTMDEMSATADASSSSEASFVVDSVGDMPTTFKSAKQSSDVAQ